MTRVHRLRDFTDTSACDPPILSLRTSFPIHRRLVSGLNRRFPFVVYGAGSSINAPLPQIEQNALAKNSQHAMNLLNHLWDDTVAGPPPEDGGGGLGKLRKFSTFNSRPDSRNESENPNQRSLTVDTADDGMKVTRSIKILKSPRNQSKDSPPSSPSPSPAGSTPPVSPFSFSGGPAFRPTAPELMRYLARFVTGHPIGSDVPILVKDLYQSNTEPWQIFPNSDEELIVLYFFTPKLPAKPLYRRHMVLGDGRGTWKLEKDRQQVIRQGNVYGYKRRFRYQNKKLPQHHDHFELKEYSLTETARAGVKGPLKDYVLCRMRRLFEVDPSTMVTDIAEIIRITSNMIGRGAAEEEEEESQDADAGEDDTQWLTLGFSSFGLPK